MVGHLQLREALDNHSHPRPQSRRQQSHKGGANEDLERGPSDYGHNSKPKPNLFRYRDEGGNGREEDDARREELKKTLLNWVDQDQFTKFRKSEQSLDTIKNKKVRAFYEEQNERINDWIEVDNLVMALADDVLDSMDPDHDGDGQQERRGGLQTGKGNIWEFLPEEEKVKRAKGEKKARWAININVMANVLLLAAKLAAATQSSSLSLLASLLDSALDLLCTLIVWTTNRLVAWRLSSLNRHFPVGRRRLEPLGILVFSIIMVISFAQILQESVQKLWKQDGEVTELPPAAIGAMAGTVVLKGIIWIGSAQVKTTQVQALAQDCKTDVYFNTLSLLFPLIGAHAGVWWLDPVGAALLSLFIIYDWGSTCFENVTRLSGQAAGRKLQRKLLYMAYRFSPVVEGFKSIQAYHAGDGVWVELDCLMSADTKLGMSHDISETMQYCCEGLPEVDRAFVTTDYTSQGPTGHATDAERT